MLLCMPVLCFLIIIRFFSLIVRGVLNSKRIGEALKGTGFLVARSLEYMTVSLLPFTPPNFHRTEVQILNN